MNRGLLVFSILVIVVGALVYYPIAIIGVILLIPALTTTPKPKTPNLPTGSAPQRTPTVLRRQNPSSPSSPAQRGPAAVDAAMTPVPTAYSPSMMEVPSSLPQSQMQPFSYSSPLFPTTMFPSMSQAAQPMRPAQAEKEGAAKRPETDELLEIGLLFAILKLAAS